MSAKIHELFEEFRTVVMGRSNLLDSILPPLLFVVANILWGLPAAMASSLVAGGLITLLRLLRRQKLVFALGGIAGAGVAILIAWLLDRQEGFFVPSMVSGGLSVLLCLLSIVLRRPLVAWTSHLARRWPRDWYWHPRVRPAYSEVTAMWLVFFLFRFLLQLNLFAQQAAGSLAWLNLILGWPATIALLVISYLYGTWRLRRLGGPSVEEFKLGIAPPWTGQQRGF